VFEVAVFGIAYQPRRVYCMITTNKSPLHYSFQQINTGLTCTAYERFYRKTSDSLITTKLHLDNTLCRTKFLDNNKLNLPLHVWHV